MFIQFLIGKGVDMNTSRDWEKTIRRLELLMRLKSFPVAFKMLERVEELDEIPFMRRLNDKTTMCQLITLVRSSDWTVGAVAEDFISPTCPSIIGLADTPPLFKDGTFRSIVWVKTRRDGMRYEESIQRLPMGKYKAVAVAPLVYNPFDPDIVLIYANPAQMMLLINSLQFEDYEVMNFFCVGESSCSDAIARCYLTGKPSLTIPCYGERRYGHAQDDDLVMALTPESVDKALRGMEALYRRGIRYPISFAGAERDLTTSFPMAYGGISELEAIRGKDNRLLVGVTGGIASGKTTVANMLNEKGAAIIDFDVLARLVVEPDKPAWKQIVNSFGEQVLNEDRTLDRKALSQIVFNDLVKRKKLESFIHPQIEIEFVQQLNSIVAEDPNAIVQVVVPLLLELNLQYQFHKTMVVYVSDEEMVTRLAARDGISEEEARNMLRSQLPMEEKIRFADLVLDNSGSLEETRAKVDDLWDQLKAIQKDLRGL
jgi:dephospho-CoA kinase